METLPLHKATGWEVSGWIGTPRARFICGDCSRLNVKRKVMPIHWRDNNETIPVAQCQWCGAINAFFRGDRYLTYSNRNS